MEKFSAVVLDRGHDLPKLQQIFMSSDCVPDLIEGSRLADGFSRRAVKPPHVLIKAGAEENQSHFVEQPFVKFT